MMTGGNWGNAKIIVLSTLLTEVVLRLPLSASMVLASSIQKSGKRWSSCQRCWLLVVTNIVPSETVCLQDVHLEIANRSLSISCLRAYGRYRFCIHMFTKNCKWLCLGLFWFVRLALYGWRLTAVLGCNEVQRFYQFSLNRLWEGCMFKLRQGHQIIKGVAATKKE